MTGGGRVHILRFRRGNRPFLAESGRSHENKESASITNEQRYPIFSWLGNAFIIIKEKRLK